jgi:type IV pilus assembly protein PilC
MSTQLDYAHSPTARIEKRNRRGVTPWLSLGSSAVIWIIPFALAAILLAAFVSVYLSPLLLTVMVYLVYRAVMNARQRNGNIIVSYLDLAVRLNLPLVPFLSAAVRSETGRRARQLARVRATLASGSSLANALSDASDVPDDVIARVESAESLGQVRSALDLTAKENRRIADESADQPDASLYRIYVAIMLFFMSTATVGIMVFVVPKFKEIFKDFKTTLPWFTERILEISSFLTDDLGIVTGLFLVAFAGFLLVMVSLWASRIFLPSLPLPNFRRVFEWFAWRLPLAHALQRDHALAETCALFATTTRAGITLPAAAQRAMNLPVNDAFRDQLDIFRRRLVAGDTPAAAADAAGLPQLISGLLAPTSARAPDPELFTFLERFYRNRFSRLQLALRGSFGPAIVLFLAFIEGTIVVAMFLPLVKLIASVAGPDVGGSL